MLVRCFLALAAAFAVLALGTAGKAGAQPEPTMVIPPSGPCDATLPVRGTGFEPTRGPTTILRLYLLQPGSADISSGILNPAFVDQDGAFSAWAPLYEHGCEAAALDSKAEQPAGHLVIAAAGSSSGEPVVAPGEPIPDIIAVAQYAYTTTTPRVPTEIMTISPSSGPCDATVEVRGQGFPPSTAIRLDMGVPKGDGTMGKLASLITDPSGRFVTKVELGSLGCRAAVLDDHYSGQLWIFADLEERVIEPQGIPPILTRTAYTYTTTQVGPEPTMVISPASGPCDAPLEARGSGFPLPRAPTEAVRLYLVRPGTSDVNMSTLNAAFVEPDGTFTARLGPAEPRCQAAALDSQAEQPTGHLLIAATSTLRGPSVEPGEPIPDIIALARYEYTTTTLHVPTETMAVSPTSGPCDGTIEISGSGFEPGMEVRLDLGAPGSDAAMGTLASVVADTDGRFAVEVTLGELGCRAAQRHLVVAKSAPPQLGIGAYEAAPSTPPLGIPPGLAGARYTFTTTELTATPSGALPPTGTGSGLEWSETGMKNVALSGALAAGGLLMVAAGLAARRRVR